MARRVHFRSSHATSRGQAARASRNVAPANSETTTLAPTSPATATSPAKPIAVSRGDTVRVTCTHDATLRKQLPQLKTLPPRYVVWGEGTSDEMCLGVMIFAPKS